MKDHADAESVAESGVKRGLERLRAFDWLSAILYLLVALPLVLLYDFMTDEMTAAIALFVGVTVVYTALSYAVESRPKYGKFLPATMLLIGLSGSLLVSIAFGWIPGTLLAVVHTTALALVVVYLLIVTGALYHHLRDKSGYDLAPDDELLSVIIPAYNEEGYVGRTIEALLATDYAEENLQIVVVDDGSTDGTYEEAKAYASEQVTVVTKENGGKYSALNYGLMFCDGEYVVTIDADSLVAEEALRRIVAPLKEDPATGAVAGNVKVTNRDSLVTKCQALEYVVSINIYRRVFDLAGVVTVVPGCLGAYRRDVLEEVFAYDPETLTEDFDVTLKVLKQGYKVRASRALVYTEAPATWSDLYNQRIRWYRGNFMTVFKHWDVLVDTRYGLLHRLAFPLRVIEMFFLPVASAIIFGVIAYLLATGAVVPVLALFVFFVSIIFLITLLAIVIEDEDLRLAAYSPLFVVGYKHFHDLVTAKSCFDVLTRSDLTWTQAKRIKQRDADR